MYEVEITGGDRDPPPTYTHEGLNGVLSRMGSYLRQALDAQRIDGLPRAITIRLPSPRRANSHRRGGRRRQGTRNIDAQHRAPADQRGYSFPIDDNQEQIAARMGGESEQETHHGRPKLRY